MTNIELILHMIKNYYFDFMIAIIKIKVLLYSPFLLIHWALFHLSTNKELILLDMKKLGKTRKYVDIGEPDKTLFILLTTSEAFRTQFLFRLGRLGRLIPWFRGLNCCDLGRGTKIGGGLELIHGYGVVINSYCSIGENCTIHQNVTIGEIKGKVPTIGNNVYIGANALVLGGGIYRQQRQDRSRCYSFG